MNTQKYHITWWIVLWSNGSLSSQNIFWYLKIFCMQCRKNITVEDRKIMSIANFINIYRNIHTYIILYYIILYYIILYLWQESLKIKTIQETQYCSMIVLLTIIDVQCFPLQDFHIWSCVPDSANGR